MKIILVSIIRLYKFFISPILPGTCRFVPSCSQYAVEAITQYGAIKGLYLAVRRILRCHPWHPGGFDPVR
jgi:putative membrane protein insertion efficiency factor